MTAALLVAALSHGVTREVGPYSQIGSNMLDVTFFI